MWYLNMFLSIEFKIVCISHYHCVKIFKICSLNFATAHTFSGIPSSFAHKSYDISYPKVYTKTEKNRATKPHIAYSTAPSISPPFLLGVILPIVEPGQVR